MVFVHTDDYNADETPVNEQVWLMNVDGSDQHPIT